MTQPSPPTKSTNKTPWRFTVADWFSPEYHGLPDTRGNTVTFRAYIPWAVGSVDQLSRISIPVVTASAVHPNSPLDGGITDTPTGPAGLGDVEFYDVSLLRTSYGQWSLGPVFSFPTGTHSGVGNGKWTLGPAIGLSTKEADWTLGFFSQGYFSFAGNSAKPDVEKLKVQPLLILALPHDWEVGASEMNFTYDRVKNRFTNIPLGFTVGKGFELWSQKFKCSQQVEYNFAKAGGTSAWTFRFTVEYLLPQ